MRGWARRLLEALCGRLTRHRWMELDTVRFFQRSLLEVSHCRLCQFADIQTWDLEDA